MTKIRNTRFRQKLDKAYEIASEPIIQEADYPEFRGLTFEEFWDKLNKKLGVDIPYLDYERELEEELRITGDPKDKHVWVKKCGGIGITECVLRWITWKCVKDNEWKKRHIDIDVILITGPRLDLAITIIRRLKALFPNLPKTKETVFIINGVKIAAFPSHHVASAHGLNPIVVLMEEGDLFPVNQQYEAREVAERYIPKTNPWIIWVSTAYLPGGLYEQIEQEEKCMYKRLFFLMDRALKDGRYTQEQDDKWKESPSYLREAWGEYGYGLGDVFPEFDELIEEYDLSYLGGSAGTYADPGFGSSKFGRVTGEIRDGIIYVIEADEFERESPSRMLDVMEQSYNRHQQNVKVDASNPGFIKDLNERGIPALGMAFGEQVPEAEGINPVKQGSHKGETTTTLKKKLPIVGSMAVKRKTIRIHPNFKALISQMRAVMFDKMGGIDKSQVPFDLVDAFNMMVWDLKQVDYGSIHLTNDGNVVKDLKSTPRKKSVVVNTEVVE